MRLDPIFFAMPGILLLKAFRAHAVSEHDIRMLFHILLKPLPHLTVISYLVAVHANRRNSLKGFDMRQCAPSSSRTRFTSAICSSIIRARRRGRALNSRGSKFFVLQSFAPASKSLRKCRAPGNRARSAAQYSGRLRTMTSTAPYNAAATANRLAGLLTCMMSAGMNGPAMLPSP